MKKALTLVLTLLIVLTMAVPAFAANDDTPTHEVELNGKVDVLAGLTATYNAKTKTNIDVSLITDGIYAADLSSTAGNGGKVVYANVSICAKADAAAVEADGQYTFAGVDKKYPYVIEIAGVNNATVDSFTIWTTTNTVNADGEYCAPFYHMDAAYDILVSCDGGKTYQIAYTSIPFTTETVNDALVVKTMAGQTPARGGNAEIISVAGGIAENNNVLYTARKMTDKFNKTYTGVTNVVYAPTALRRGGASSTDPFYYAARISEFDVYEAKAEVPATADTAVYFVAFAVVALGAAYVTVKKIKEN